MKTWYPKLKDYIVSEVEWLTKPLERKIAGRFGDKHSWIKVKFKLNFDNKPKSTQYTTWNVTFGAAKGYEFIVERHVGGIYIDKAKDETDSSSFKRTEYSVKYKDLRSFLVACVQQDKAPQYNVSTKNCHHFAKAAWNACTKSTSYVYKVPND